MNNKLIFNTNIQYHNIITHIISYILIVPQQKTIRTISISISTHLLYNKQYRTIIHCNIIHSKL